MNLLPKSQRPEELHGTALYRYIDMIKIDMVHNFVVDVLNQYGDEDSLLEANLVADAMFQKLLKKKIVSEQVYPSYVDIMLCSALIHNIFYDPEDWTTLFDARLVLTPLAKEHEFNENMIEAIFQNIEAQLGADTPVPLCRPNPGTPPDALADAVWYVKEYEPQV